MRITAELTFPRELKQRPVFYEMVKKFDVVPTIIEASFSSSTGWAYVTLEGEEEVINTLINYLESLNVIVDRRE